MSNQKNIEETIEKSRWLLDLPENWEDENAERISEKTWLNATNLLRKIGRGFSNDNLSLKMPAIGPVADGSIDLFWNSEKSTLLINVYDVNEANFYYHSLLTSYSGSFNLNAPDLEFLKWSLKANFSSSNFNKIVAQIKNAFYKIQTDGMRRTEIRLEGARSYEVYKDGAHTAVGELKPLATNFKYSGEENTSETNNRNALLEINYCAFEERLDNLFTKHEVELGKSHPIENYFSDFVNQPLFGKWLKQYCNDHKDHQRSILIAIGRIPVENAGACSDLVDILQSGLDSLNISLRDASVHACESIGFLGRELLENHDEPVLWLNNYIKAVLARPVSKNNMSPFFSEVLQQVKRAYCKIQNGELRQSRWIHEGSSSYKINDNLINKDKYDDPMEFPEIEEFKNNTSYKKK